MRTAVGGVDIVGEGADVVVITVVILHRDLNLAGILHVRGSQVDDLVMDRRISLFLVYVIDKFADTALKEEGLVRDMLGITLILELNVDARIQKSLFSESSR